MVATLALLVVHRIPCPASSGATSAVSCIVLLTAAMSMPSVFPVTLLSPFRIVTAIAAGLTVTSMLSEMPLPSVAVAVIVTACVPVTFFAITLPEVTVATFGLELLHETLLLFASAGPTTAVSCMYLPAATSEEPVILMDFTIVATLMLTIAFMPLPSVAVAAMVAVPLERPVTSPSCVTVATPMLLLDQTMPCDASSGFTTAESCIVLFSAARSIPNVFPVTLLSPFRIVTAIAAGLTVTSMLSEIPLPSAAVAVMVTVCVPVTAFAVTLPEVTVATFGLELLHETLLLFASAGPTTAVSCMYLPAATSEEPVILMDFTIVATLMLTIAFMPLPSVAVAAMVAVPLERPVTSPSCVTVATPMLLLDQTMPCDASSGFTTAESCIVLFSAARSIPSVCPVTALPSLDMMTDAATGLTVIS